MVALLTVSGLLLYANTLNYPQFLFDGELFLRHNPFIKELRYFTKIFDLFAFAKLDEQMGLPPDMVTSFLLRPVSYLSFALNYLADGFNPAGYRGVNIVIHCLNAILLFLALDRILERAPFPGRPDSFSRRFIPAATALVFLLHPMQTESVTYITQRFTSLGALFYLLTLWLYLVGRQEERTRSGRLARFGSAALLFLGMFAQEGVVTAPVLLLAMELILFRSTLRAALARCWPHLALLPVIPILVCLVQMGQSQGPAHSSPLDIVNYGGYGVLQYALTQSVVVWSYLRLYLVPYGLNADPDPPLHAVPDLPVVAALAALVAVGVAGYLYFRRDRGAAGGLVFFGLCWYFLTVSVSSSLVPQPDLMAEHRAYLSSAGFLLVLATLADRARRSFKESVVAPRLALGGLALCLVLLGALTVQRNQVWSSKEALWRDAASKSPGKARPWFNLGLALKETGQYEASVPCFQTALRIDPRYGGFYEGIVTSLICLSRFTEAVAYGEQGIKAAPNSPLLHNNLGVAYLELGQTEAARRLLRRALELRPGYDQASKNLLLLDSSAAPSRSNPPS